MPDPNPVVAAVTAVAPAPLKHWRLVLRFAWTPRLIAMMGLLDGLNAVWPNLGGTMSPITFNLIGFALAAITFYSRFIKQDGVPHAE